jgi:hypothetical protein
MKTAIIFVIFLAICLYGKAQIPADSTLRNKYFRLVPTSAQANRIELSSDIDCHEN